HTICALGTCMIICGALIKENAIQQYFLQKYYFYIESGNNIKTLFERVPDELPRVFRARSPYQKIDIVDDPSSDLSAAIMPAYSTKLQEYPNYPSQRILFLNGDFQTNSTFDEVYHEYFAHVPIIARGVVPEKILVLGGGDGILIRELTKYSEIKSITHVDLDETLINLAKTNKRLLEINHGSLNDPRVHGIISDGYQFVRSTDQTFDAIYIDFPVPVDYDLSKLYSREFFTFIRKRITETGFAVFDATGIGLLSPFDLNDEQTISPLNDWPYYYNTLRAAGFRAITPYLSNLELDNPQASEILTQEGTPLALPIEFLRAVRFANNRFEALAMQRAFTQAISRSVIEDHVFTLQQGFIIMNHQSSLLGREYQEFSANYNLMNAQRFKRAFMYKFSQPSEIDYSKVNSIMRPTFPTTPTWKPRLPY
ncbi:MAG: hypothetical protein KDD53_04635, partial [Bdellovibrionales bacterium]|nr:hypothetical protein [Bdellovibrionales bacterium]